MKCYTYSYLFSGLLIFNFCGAMQQEPEIMPAPQVAEQPMAETPSSAPGSRVAELEEILAQSPDAASQFAEIRSIVEQFRQDLAKNPAMRDELLSGKTACVPSDLRKKVQEVFGPFLTAQDMNSLLDTIEPVYGLLSKVLPGLDLIKVFEVSRPQDIIVIFKAMNNMAGDLVRIERKGYTPDVIPFTIKAALRPLLKGKDAGELIGVMNTTYSLGLPYLTNAVAALFVENQLPTTIPQKGLAKVKQLFCMGQLDPEDLMEKAVDMGVNKEIAEKFIKKHVGFYKKHFSYEECTVADWVFFRESLEKNDTPKDYVGGLGVLGTALKPLVKRSEAVFQELEKQGIYFMGGLTSLEGMKLLAGMSDLKTLIIVGYKGEKIKAHSFTDMSQLQELYLGGFHARDFVIEDHAFSGLRNLASLTISNSPYKAGTWSAWITSLAGGKGALNLNLRKEMFAGLDQLKRLEIRDVHVPYLQAGIFDAMPQLLVLRLENMGLSTIEAKTFQQLSELGNLYLNDNSINQIDDRAFEGLSNLTRLSLQNNNLSSLHAGQFKDLKKLRFLDVEGNPASKDVLTKLRRGLRKGCYLAFDTKYIFASEGWRGMLLKSSELQQLNDELMHAQEGE